MAAVSPQAQCDQHDDALAAFPVPLALAAILFDACLLGLQTEPDAIKLGHCRNIVDWFAMGFLQERFELIDPFIDRP